MIGSLTGYRGISPVAGGRLTGGFSGAGFGGSGAGAAFVATGAGLGGGQMIRCSHIHPMKMKKHSTIARVERLSTYFLSYLSVAPHFGHFRRSSVHSRVAPHLGQGRSASSISMTGMSSLME